MSIFAPFALPFCLALSASAIGIALQRRLFPGAFGYWLQAAIYLGTVFATTFIGRLALGIVGDSRGLATILPVAILLSLSFAWRLTRAASDDDGRDALARKGFSGVLIASSIVALVLALGLSSVDRPIPGLALVFLALLPAAVALAVLRDGP